MMMIATHLISEHSTCCEAEPGRLLPMGCLFWLKTWMSMGEKMLEWISRLFSPVCLLQECMECVFQSVQKSVSSYSVRANGWGKDPFTTTSLWTRSQTHVRHFRCLKAHTQYHERTRLPSRTIQIWAVDEVKLSIGPVELFLVIVEGESVGPVNVSVNDNRAMGPVHPSTLDLWYFTPVCPIHVAVKEKRHLNTLLNIPTWSTSSTHLPVRKSLSFVSLWHCTYS